MKTIGLLTSGGDAPGMNACIAAAAAKAESRGAKVRGIFRGFEGLLDGNTIPIGSELSGLARRGGSFLGASRDGGLEDTLRRRGLADVMQRCGIDGLVVLGGGGSLGASARLAEDGARVVGVPCTIDNDIPGTDYSLGFDSAVNKAARAANEIMDTAESLPGRVFLVETLGGVTGHIALATAYAAAADAVFIHEIEPDVDAAARKIRAKMEAGGTHGLVVLCENLGTAKIAQELAEAIGRRVHVTALGHTQRGGSPTFLDRMLAREFGEAAVEMLLEGESGRMVTHRDGSVGSVALTEIAGKYREIDMSKYRAVNGPDTTTL